jgi:hypothetical protein
VKKFWYDHLGGSNRSVSSKPRAYNDRRAQGQQADFVMLEDVNSLII